MAHLPHVLLISQSLTNQPVAFFCFLSSTLYPSYQQQGVTNYQTLFIMSKCIYTALVGEEMPQSSDQITWDENMHQGKKKVLW